VSSFGSLEVATSKWYGGVLALDGMIYGIPITVSASVLKINPNNDTASTFGTVSGATWVFGGGVLAPNGSIYTIPM
jgi:hypothetical protein